MYTSAINTSIPHINAQPQHMSQKAPVTDDLEDGRRSQLTQRNARRLRRTGSTS